MCERTVSAYLLLLLLLFREAETRDPRSGPHVSQGIAQGDLPSSGGVNEN